MNNKNYNLDQKEFQKGERLYLGKTKSDENSIKEHISRYYFAKKYLKPNSVVLDVACGSGYGSEILSQKASRVVGLEISEHALSYAEKYHQRPNIEFRKADLNKPLDLSDNFFDIIASFETLEHISNQENMLSEIKRILKPNGLLIISSPDREIITEKAGTENKFHTNELSKKEFIGKLRQYFKLEELYGQTKFIPLPLQKKFIKKIAKLDILRIRRWIVKILGLRFVVHKHFSPMGYSPIERVDFESPNEFYVLIAVCRK